MIKPNLLYGNATPNGGGAVQATPVPSYPELQQQLHNDLIAQHPEWIEANGDCPTCEEYDRRFAQLISIFQATNRNPVTV
jgi:hypothetical protein